MGSKLQKAIELGPVEVARRLLRRGVRLGRGLLRRAMFWRWFDFLLVELALVPFLFFAAWRAGRRSGAREVDVGLGPQPLINNVYHRRALHLYGYSAETFVYTDNFISSEYDLNLADKPWHKLRKGVFLFLRAIRRYRAIFIYFDGGPLFDSKILRRLEPRLYRLAKLKVVAMPFGSDVQVMMRSRNLHFKHALAHDYPHQNKGYRRVSDNLDRWSMHADAVLSGCEWVDYMYHWTHLQIAHFSIDMDQWQPGPSWRPISKTGPLRVFHAPNHKSIKGTQPLLQAIERLRAEGLDIELVTRRGVPNTEIREVIQTVDLVADQFVIGWYAMFALEAMCLKKPVLCYLREDLEDLYVKAGLLEKGECPLISADVLQIEERLRWAYHHRDELERRAEAGRPYVKRHHSLGKIGGDFAEVLRGIGIEPSGAARPEAHDGADVDAALATEAGGVELAGPSIAARA